MKDYVKILFAWILAVALLMSNVYTIAATEPTDVSVGYNGYTHAEDHIVGAWGDACADSTPCTSADGTPIYWSDLVPAGCPFEESEYEGIVFTGKYANYTNADTWYPSWAEDGHLYSQWTDGSINGIGIMSIDNNSGNESRYGIADARTGQARIEGDDPMNLKVVNLGSLPQSGVPTITGRYPCANLVYNGTWYNGSYLLTYNNQSADEGCDIWNWPQVEGFVGLRTATMQNWEEGSTITKADYPWNRYITAWDEEANFDENGNQIWVTEDRDGTTPLFGEYHDVTGEIRFGAPHFVDFGQNMEYAPVVDGEKKAYLVGHGSTQYGAFNSWVQGDAIYLARVTPDPETINDIDAWEFYAGRDTDGNEVWSSDFAECEPIAQWDSHMGNVAVTYNAPLDKYFMTYSRGITQTRYDSAILEADSITGPYKMIHYLENFGPVTYFTNIPSKFISEDGLTMWLCSSGNFYNKASGYPEHSHYSMMFREFKLVKDGDDTPVQEAAPVYYADTENPESIIPYGVSNIALNATATASTTYSGYKTTAMNDGNLGGYGATSPLEAKSAYEWASKGQGVGAWAKLEWTSGQTIGAVRLFDRPNTKDHILMGTLEFSDGTKVSVESLPDDGHTGRAINLETPLKNITWVKYTVDAVGVSENIGLSEFEVYNGALSIGTENPQSAVPGDATNIALSAAATASTTYNGYQATAMNDGNLGGYGATSPLVAKTAYEWASKGQGVGAWAKLEWTSGQTISAVRLFDRPNTKDHILMGTLEFSDGTKVSVGSLPDNGHTGRAINLETPLENITWVKYTVDGVRVTTNIGLSEFEVYDKPLYIEDLHFDPNEENLALNADVTTSPTMVGYPDNVGINDGVADGWPRNTAYEWRSNGDTEGAWVELSWDEAQTVSTVQIYQNQKRGERIAKARLVFNGDYANTIPVNFDINSIEAVAHFEKKSNVKSIRLIVDAVQSGDANVNITEICVYEDFNFNSIPSDGVLESEFAVLQGTQLVADERASLGYTALMQDAESRITFTAAEDWESFSIVYIAKTDAVCNLLIDGVETAVTLPKTGTLGFAAYPVVTPVKKGQSIVITTPKAAGPVTVDCLKEGHTVIEDSEITAETNLALGKPVAGSSNNVVGSLVYNCAYLVDGSQGSRTQFWQPKESLGGWAKIDLGDCYKLSKFIFKLPSVWPEPRDLEMEILVSADDENYATAVEKNLYVFHPADNSNIVEVVLPEDANVYGRYIKLVLGASKYWTVDNPEKTFSLNGQLSEVEVYGEELDAVTDITLSAESLALKAGQKATVTADIDPATAIGRELSWSSDDISVATVDSYGSITAIKAGTCTVTVKTKQGVSAELTLTVLENNIESMERFDCKRVPIGTHINNIVLPTMVEVTLDGSKTELYVAEWICEDYNSTKAGTYTFYAGPVLLDGITNTSGLKAELQVEVYSDVYGDINGDGGVTIADVLTLIKALLNDTSLENGDMNDDGKVSLIDVLRVMKLIIK